MRKFNLSLDDYSPRENTNNLYWCDKLIEKYPDIKIDLFVPAAYCRLKESPNYISKSPEWIKKTKALPKNYSICLHGLFHRRSKVDFKFHKKHESNNDEFQHLQTKEAAFIVDKMVHEFYKSGIKYKKIFRPPGWRISRQAANVLYLRDFIIAGDKAHEKTCGQDKAWVSYNWDLTGPCKADGDVLAYGHTSSWTNNCMDEKRFNLICDLLRSDTFLFLSLDRIWGLQNVS